MPTQKESLPRTEKERSDVYYEPTSSDIAKKAIRRSKITACSRKPEKGKNGTANTKRSRNDHVPVRGKANAKPIKEIKKTPTMKNLRDNIRNCDKKLEDRDKEIVELQKQLAAAREENTELLRHSRTKKKAFNWVISDTIEEAKKKIKKAEAM